MMDALRRLGDRYSSLDILEATALSSTVVAFWLTAILSSGGIAVEANPVAAALLDSGGWMLAGSLAVVVEAAIFAYYRRIHAEYPRAAVAGGGLVAAVGVLDVVANVALLATAGWPETIHYAHYAPVAGVVAGVAVAAGTARCWLPIVRSLDRGHLPSGRVVAVIAIGLMVVVAGGGIDPIGLEGAVQNASAAATVIADWEEGDLSDATSDPGGSWQATSKYAIEGSYSAYYDGSAGEQTVTVDFSDGAYSELTTKFYPVSTSSCGTNDYCPKITVYSPTPARIAEIRVRQSGAVEYRDSALNWQSTGSSTPADGTWYELGIADVTPSANTYDVVLDGTVIANDITAINSFSQLGDYRINSDVSSGTFAMDFGQVDGATIGVEVSGTVTDASGDSVEGATVNLTQSGSVLQSTSTNTNGEYKFTGVEDGNYTVKVTKDGYEPNSTNITVSGAPVTANVTICEKPCNPSTRSSYKQGIRLKDHTGEFPASGSTLSVDVWKPDGDPVIGEAEDWQHHASSEFNYKNLAYFKAYDADLYRLQIHGQDDAMWEVVGWTPPENHSDPYVKNVTIGEPNTTATPTTTAAGSDSTIDLYDTDGGYEIVYQGPPTREFNYNLSGPNGSYYTVNRTFDDPTSYYEGEIGANFSGVPNSGATLDYYGEYANGSVFSGSTNVTGTRSGFIGNESRSGGGAIIAPDTGSGAPVWTLLLPAVAALGYAGYRRYTGSGAGGAVP